MICNLHVTTRTHVFERIKVFEEYKSYSLDPGNPTAVTR